MESHLPDPVKGDERHLFEYSPISLWEEDFSQVKAELNHLAAQNPGDLRALFSEHPELVDRCEQKIRVLDVNRKTLELFGARDKRHLLDNLHLIFRDEMRAHFLEELLDIAAGKLAYEREGINYALDGRKVYVRVHFSVLPGYEKTYGRVLVALEDITARREAELARQASEAHFHGLFENSPISLWEEDFSGIKRRLDGLRAEGVDDFLTYLDQHPEFVEACEAAIRVVDVNRKTLELFQAQSKEHLLANLHQVFRDQMSAHFREELVDMWNGKTSYDREGINYALNGNPLDVHIFFSVLPGFEDTFERVIVALEDITVRKRTEKYLKYLGTHDVLTGLLNRASFEEQMASLRLNPVWPVTVVICDLDGLKRVNDSLGHQTGDGLIRRAAEVLESAFAPDFQPCRIGGDEFCVILPGVDSKAGARMDERIERLVKLNNTYYQGPALSLSVGVAVSQEQEEIDAVFRRADDLMYQIKRRRHAAQ